jgi:hypothetical protein
MVSNATPLLHWYEVPVELGSGWDTMPVVNLMQCIVKKSLWNILVLMHIYAV